VKRPVIRESLVVSKIFMLRGQRVMLDYDLSDMYGIETRRLNEQVKRNLSRFPDDFMFQITEKEFENLKSQNATSRWGGRRKLPYAFTEHGVLMLSSVLNSRIAIQVNIKIMRVYTKMREVISANREIVQKLEKMEKTLAKHDRTSKKHEEQLQLVFRTLKQLLTPPLEPRRKIGYKTQDD
jgi:hypothetical protein